MNPWNDGDSYEPEPEDERMPFWARAFWSLIIGVCLAVILLT